MKVKRPKNIYAKEEEKEEEPEPLDLDLIPDRDAGLNRPKLKKDEILVDYARSKQAVEQRITNDLREDLGEADNEKMRLIQNLNKKLLELDQLNLENRDMNAELIRRIKFSRDLQASLGTSNNGPLNDIIDKEMEEDFRKEKQK